MNKIKQTNQYTDPDPRQALFLKYYLSPKSKTFANVKQSGIKAGYSEKYAERLLSEALTWLSNSIKDSRLVKNAEKRLNQVLELEPVDETGKIDNSLIANQMKGINLVLKGLEKERFSERTEHTGADGEDLKIVFDQSFKKDA